MIDDYINHIKNGESLIARIYGIFSIKTEYFKNLDIIVMQNSSLFFSDNSKKTSFDLKGSLINRFNKYDVRNISNPKFKNTPLLKDLNFIQLQNYS